MHNANKDLHSVLVDECLSLSGYHKDPNILKVTI